MRFQKMNDVYKRAYTEVIEIIKYFPKEEYNKIPIKKINFYKENMDKNYKFQINPKISLEEQNISKEANAILITIFNDYFATYRQKEVLNNLLKKNQQKIEQDKLKKYNPDNIFKKNISEIPQEEIKENTENMQLIEYKENIFKKIFNKIKSIFIK